MSRGERVVGSGSSSATWLTAWTGAVLSAGLVALVLAQPGMRVFPGSTPSDPRMARLVAAVGAERYIEPRLSGGFRYGPLRPLTRAANGLLPHNLTLLAAAGETQRAAQNDPSPQNLHAWGVAQLLLGDADGAVASLEGAACSAHAPANWKVDASAALAARAAATRHSEDWHRALQLADEGLALEAGNVEGLYNRALILEGMDLSAWATGAWDEVLVRDRNSPWALEAARHAARLRLEVPVRNDAAHFGSDLGEGVTPDGSATTRLVAERPEAAFDWLLQSWRLVCSDTARYRMVAEAFANHTHDPLFSTLSRLDEACTPAWTATWAAIEQLQLQMDRAHLAAQSLEAVGSLPNVSAPTAALRSLAMSRAAYIQHDYSGLATETDRGLVMARREGYTVATAKLLHLKALGQYLVGQQEAALNTLESATSMLGDARMAAGRARELALVAAWREFRGEGQRTVDLLAEAIRVARTSDMADLRVSAFETAADAAMFRGNSSAAIAFLETLNASLQPEAAPVARAINGAGLTSAYLAQGRVQEAARHLADAEQAVAQLGDDPRGKSLSARLASLRAELALAVGRTGDALRAADEALAAVPASYVTLRLSYELTRARATLQGGDVTASGRSVEELLGRFRALHSAPAVGRAGFEGRIQSLAREVATRMLDGRDSRAALRLLQRAQAELLEGGTARSAVDGTRGVVIPPGTAVVCLTRLDIGLATWVVYGDDVRFAVVDAGRVDAALVVLQAAIRRQDLGDIKQALAHLDRLIFAEHAATFSKARRVVVVPDAPSTRLPFGAMAATDAVLSGKGLSVTSSLFAVRPARVLVRPRTLLALGNERFGYGALPPLPGVDAELAAISVGYDRARLVTAPGIVIASLANELAASDVVHIAAHSVVEPVWRGSPRLILGEGDAAALTPPVLARLRFGASSTVLLSACSTAASISSFSDPTSLATSIVDAGARSVVASIIDLPDRGARPIFARVHADLRAGTTPEDAVARTLLWALAQDDPAVAIGAIGLVVVE